MTRDHAMYVTSKTRWLLIRLAKAANSKKSEQDTSQTTESILEGIVEDHIEETCPQLLEIYEKRKALDDEGEQYARQRS